MFKNYVLIALRKLSREKAYVLINIASLSLGIAGFLILALYLRSELTYDRHHVNHERIYRVTAKFIHAQKGTETHFAASQAGLGPLLVKDFPQLGQYVRFQLSMQNVVTYEDNSHEWESIYLTDPAVFDAFTHEIIHGDPHKALVDPHSIAISETFARHYFGDANPIGKKVVAGARTYAVTLVFADLPDNTHLKYDALIPISILDTLTPPLSSSYTTSLWNVNLYTYLMVPENFDTAGFDAIGAKFFDTYMGAQGKEMKEVFQPRLQKLTDIHFGDSLEGDQATGNIFYAYGFAAVALFILIVACINYVNLATARAAKRAKEVGMRKVLGADRAQLVAQFLGESFTFTAIALVLALIVIALALTVTPLASLMDKQALLSQLAEPVVAGGALGVAVVVALAAGLYPALYLSSISPLAALTHVRRSWQTGLSLRQVLVFAQLAISIAVIACTMLMIDQMNYVHDKPLGFAKENRLIVNMRGFEAASNIPSIKAELRQLRNVVDVTTITNVPGTGNAINLIPIETNEGTMEPTELHRIQVGLNFVQAMKLEMVEGRALSEDIASDVWLAFMVNESFVKKMGWTEPLGKRLMGSRNPEGKEVDARVVGVVKDFNYASLHDAVGPLLIHAAADRPDPRIPDTIKPILRSSFIVVLTGEDMQNTLDNVAAVIKRFNPKFVFEPVFLEDRLNDLYKMETNLMKLTGLFAGVCIFISIMGIFGLAAFTTEQRTKEIGIRKVLGAADSQIVTMLTRPLLWLVLAAAIPASYAGYRAIDAWLQRFAYHTEIRPLTFIFATLAVALIAVGTVVLQSLRTANTNPVDALRYE